MRRGARIKVKYLMNRFAKAQKCVVCEKALRLKNKSGLCSADMMRERAYNRRNQLNKSGGKNE